MPPIPNVQQTILDPGLGIVGALADRVVCMGTCSAGTLDYLYSFSTPKAVTETLGQGPLAELVCSILEKAGGPVYAIRVTGSVAGAAGAVSPSLVGTATGVVTVAGAPYDGYPVTVHITKTGTVGVGEFRYRLDKSSTELTGGTWSENLTIPAGGTYAIPNTNLTLTFTPNGGPVFFEKDDVHTFTCTAPYYSTANWTAAAAALANAGKEGLVVLAGNAADAADAVAMFAAVSTKLSAMEAAHQYFGALMNAGNDTEANVLAAMAAVASVRMLVEFGTANVASSKPFAGWGNPAVPAVNELAAQTMRGTISDDPSRKKTGALIGVTAISHDERTATTPVNEEPHKISTLRTFVGEPGFYVTNAWMKGPSGTDYRYIQHRRVMDRACSIAYTGALTFLNDSLRILTDGTGRVDPRDKAAIDSYVQGQLEAALVQQRNLSNHPHVSGILFEVDADFNVLVNEAFQYTVQIVPLSYNKQIAGVLGFTAQIALAGGA